MKIKNSIVALAACASIVTFIGCSKSNEPAAGSSSVTNAAMATATDAMATAAITVTEAVTNAAAVVTDTAKNITAKAVAAITPADTNAIAAAATSQVNDIVSQAKSYIADKKYTEALDALKKLSGMALTADQQKTVDDLKDEATKLLAQAGGAVDAAKNLLGK